MSARFNPPPGWPAAPNGWTPPPGWTPDPSWPPPPPGWSLWVDDSPTPPPAHPAAPTQASSSQPPRGFGFLGGPKKADLVSEVDELRAALERLGAGSAVDIARELDRSRRDVDAAKLELARLQAELAEARTQIVQTNEIAQLQEAGIYEYAHPLSDAVAYKDLLARVKADTKGLVSAGRAVSASTTWQVNGSAAQGRKMVTDFSKLLLRAYNAEADNCVRTVKPHSRRASLERLSSASATIEKLGRTMDIHITSDYHRVRLYEIELTADYLAKVEEERERLREERERMRDEQAAQREIEREKTRLAKEQAHYQIVLQRLREGAGSADAIAEIEAKLAEIGVEVDKVISREANIRAGWVYVISNIGAFGDHVVKIGMTRRLEPMDRVRELGDASVPFRFDVHALIFSNDAVTLEARLHTALQDRKVNQVNTAREFFYATPSEVREHLKTIAGQHLLEYREEPEAAEWRASGSHRAEDFFPPPQPAN